MGMEGEDSKGVISCGMACGRIQKMTAWPCAATFYNSLLPGASDVEYSSYNTRKVGIFSQ